MKLNMIIFKEDEGYVAYCPALDLCGCGKTKQKAEASFNIVLEEYIRYTTENQTLIEDLTSHGWKVDGKKLNPPKMSESMQENEYLDEIFNNYDFVKHSIPVNMPLYC